MVGGEGYKYGGDYAYEKRQQTYCGDEFVNAFPDAGFIVLRDFDTDFGFDFFLLVCFFVCVHDVIVLVSTAKVVKKIGYLVTYLFEKWRKR